VIAPEVSFSVSTMKAELYRWDWEKALRMTSSFPMIMSRFEPWIRRRVMRPETPLSTGSMD
ncbi:MAG: hypothetical protein ACLUPL_13835, partial [Butyricimonas virosa]